MTEKTKVALMDKKTRANHRRVALFDCKTKEELHAISYNIDSNASIYHKDNLLWKWLVLNDAEVVIKLESKEDVINFMNSKGEKENA